MIIRITHFAVVVALCCLVACTKSDKKKAEFRPTATDFKGYWYQGLAEISTFDLLQAVDGELHPGTMTLLFVTEDFLTEKQVKKESSDPKSGPSTSVLRTAMSRDFFTGVIPHHLTTELYTPAEIKEDSKTYKLVQAEQNWSGLRYVQYNLKGGDYELRGFSHSEAEAEIEGELDSELLEDELWARIRIAPDTIKRGNVEIIPGSIYSRLQAKAPKVEDAELSIFEEEGKNFYTLQLVYDDINRKLSIFFEKQFPYSIIGFEESYPMVEKGPVLVTRGVLRKKTQLDYWKRTKLDDLPLRKTLE